MTCAATTIVENGELIGKSPQTNTRGRNDLNQNKFNIDQVFFLWRELEVKLELKLRLDEDKNSINNNNGSNNDGSVL